MLEAAGGFALTEPALEPTDLKELEPTDLKENESQKRLWISLVSRWTPLAKQSSPSSCERST